VFVINLLFTVTWTILSAAWCRITYPVDGICSIIAQAVCPVTAPRRRRQIL
jgi:hypothetical protein